MTTRMPAEDSLLESACGTPGTLAHACLPEVAPLLAARFGPQDPGGTQALLFPPRGVGPTALKQGLIYSQ